jgi:ankyrin repeat protein
MSTLQCDSSQNNVTDTLLSRPVQPAQQSILPPFSGTLRKDEKLKLSKDSFKQSIDNFFKNKDINPIDQLTTTPAFPTPYVLAHFASKAYEDYKRRETDADYEKRLILPDGWKLLTTASNTKMNNGYFGAAFWHPQYQQVVIAHRGTKLNSCGALWTDIKGVLFKHYVKQMDSATTFAYKVIEVLQEVNREKGVHFQVFFTGHSLGGWLAQVTTYTTEYLKRGEDNNFLKNDNAPQSYHPHTVVFDSPGCKAMLSEMIDTFDVRQNGGDSVLQNLDITSYLSAPNRINTCNTHVGTVYRIYIDTSDMGWWARHTALYNAATHSMNKILKVFDPETGQVEKDEKDQLRIREVIDWPVSGRLLRRREYKRFFKWAKQFNDYQPEIKDEYTRSRGYHPVRYQTKVYEGQVNNLRIFNQEEKEFLQGFRILSKLPEFFKPKEVFSVMQNDQAEDEAGKKLQSFRIENGSVCCADASILQALIPYVRRLLQLFPEIKKNVKYASSPHEVRNRVYQFETKTCLEKIKKSALDFNPDTLGLKEFLESDQQVLHLRMVDGDAWTGLIKVYRVIEKTTGNGSFPREGQYTILNLDRFLTVNKMMDFNTFMTSTETLYLLMISWESNHVCNNETKQVFQELFNTVQEKPYIKIILTTQSEGTSVDFLQQIAMTAPTNMFVSRDEKLTWTDLTIESQKKVLEKTVEFQGREIALNELIAVDSPVACYFPISGLLGEHTIKIAEDPISNSTSYGYNDKWYIERTFNHKVAIKQDILRGVVKENFPDFLANTEQEFKLLCQQYPEKNVHLLVKDNSGKLVWQASQGSLETLRKYIDTQKSHTYPPMDLDKLLEQAQHQRLMVISDTAGMGKSTVLTHLSRQIKQKFPNSWVIRIHLNHHTDELKTLKEGTINKEKAIEFVSKELLKLKTEFDLKLFEHCSEKRQKIRIVLMLDGFDEISPYYEKVVIDLLQTLKIMSVLEFWITTRPHLRQKLEDNLQQLSYTLEPFSRENQVEFLKKFWRLRDWFTEVGNGQKGKDKKLETYARKLIMKLATSISDRDKELTGIPLQCRMLAEAFDEKVKTFYLSSDSMPDLPFKLDLLELYELFIKSKYDIYIGDKFRIPLTNVIAKNQREKLAKEAEDFHQGLAIQMLFPWKIATLQINGISTFSDEKVTEMSRIGIVQVNYEDKPHFIHRTFAEYNVANVVVNQMTKEPSPSPQVQDFVLKDVLLKEEYLVIRVFIDGLLSKSEPTIIFKQYGNRIDELSKDGVLIQQGQTTILHQAVQEGNAHIIGFLLDILKEGKHAESLNGLLLAQNSYGRTAWHLAVKDGNKELWRNLWKWAEATLTPQKINNKLLLAKDDLGTTVWHWAAKEGNTQLLDTIWGWAKENLAGEELSNGLLLANTNGKTAWHFAADMGNTQVVEKLWKWGKEILTSGELNCKLLLAKDGLEKTVWHQAAKVGNMQLLEKLWGWAKETLTPEQLNNELLLAKDLWGKTALHVALDFGNTHIATKLWECATEILTTKELNKLLLDKDTKGVTAWHSAAEVGDMEMLEKLWKYANEEKLNLKNDLLLAEDSDGHTAWLLATKSAQGASEKIWMWAEKELTLEELKNKFLLAKGFKQPTAWHLAAAKGDTYQLKNLWAWAKENLTPEELKYELLLAKDFCGNTAWLHAIQSCNIMVMRKLWIWCTQELTREEFNNTLLGKNPRGQTALHLAAKGGEAQMIQLVWEVAKKVELNFRDNFLLAEDNDGHTPWLLAANEGNVEVLEKLWVMAKEELTTEELKNKLLLAKNRKQQTVLHLAAVKGNPYALEKLWVWASDELIPEDLYHKLMLAKDLQGKTAWHRAAELGHTIVLEKVSEWLIPLMSKLNCEVPAFVIEIILAKQRDFYAWLAEKTLSYGANNTK